jgi:MFS family permease
MITSFAGCGVFAGLAFLSPGVPLFAVGIVLGILALNMVNPTYQALVAGVVPPSARATAIAFVFIAANAVAALAPLLIGVFSGRIGGDLRVTLSTVTFGFSALALLATVFGLGRVEAEMSAAGTARDVAAAGVPASPMDA